MTLRSELFRELQPPPGGVALLRERLERRRSKRAWYLGLPAVAAACGALVLLLRPGAPPDPLRAQLLADPLVHSLGLRPAQSEAATAEGSTVLARVASANPKVAVYWVDSSPPPGPLPTAGGGARELPSSSQ